MPFMERIKNFPISFFAIILGMSGFTLVFQKAEKILSLSVPLSNYLLVITVILFAIVFLLYLMKMILFTDNFINEFNHPIKLNFFPLIAKILLVNSVILLALNKSASKYLWIAGTILQLLFSIIIISSWINHSKYEIHHLNPAWFIPIVGFVIVPIAGIEFYNHEISWFFFSIGIIFWIVLFTIIINRVIFHHPIADKLIPTFFILFAPPAIAFIAYVKLTGHLDPFAKILYYFSLFMFILIIFQFKKFRKLNFFLSWWAYSFPLAAITIATIFMYHLTKVILFKYISVILLVSFSLLIIYLSIKTLKAIFSKQICVEEE